MLYRCHTTTICILFYFTARSAILPLYAQEKQIPERIICSTCNTENPAANKYCYQCGTILLKHSQKERIQSVRGDSVIKEVSKKPAGTETRFPDPGTEIKAKAIYDFGTILFNEKNYQEALFQFYRVIQDFSDSQYYEGACAMREACKRMLIFNKDLIEGNIAAGPPSLDSRLQKGCLEFFGVIGAVLLITTISG